MGGSNDTKKSFEQVQSDLQAQLLNNARALLKKDYNIDVPSTTTLEDTLKLIAINRFKAQFKFDYNDDSAKCFPPNALADSVTPIARLCSITDPASTQAADYIETMIISKANLPAWMKSNAKADLVTLSKVLLSQDTMKKWNYDEFVQSYDGVTEDQDSYKFSSVLVYTNGSLTEDALKANLCIIYFMGVYYKTNSPTKAVRLAIQQEAYDTAKLLDAASITNDSELTTALALHGQAKFSERFHYGYKSNPPDLPDSTPMISYNDHLCYVQDAKADSLQFYVQDEIFKGLNITVDSVKETAMDDTLKQFQAIVQENSTGTWTIDYIDQTYAVADPVLNPVKVNGLIIYWFDHRNVDTNDSAHTTVSVSTTYIYYMAMFYEVTTPSVVVARDLFKEMCINLINHIETESSASTTMDLLGLKDFLFTYAKQQFLKAFGFDYNGNHSTPPDKISNTVLGYDELLELPSYPPTLVDIQAFINAELFKRDSTTFPPYAGPGIYDDIQTHMLRYAGPDTPKDANMWYCEEHTSTFSDPSGQHNSIKEYALFVYALGDKREDSQGGLRIQRPLVYYLGVFCSVDKGGPAW
ncbi:hypothetical protein K435DRAFT_862200 [Dendrothele bispora CBS 962.96]|uniref:Uncharacterized protein n=1 Tax=Dendrothele bispora (strain CBS 962.96) TaxID=1314807 RepID=A0A4S8LUD3_DENBC|nr:hypothetical protein K435DRAFT_862199 [Dendrothele bispora CBS 962.96]THU92703.1 hypothetical protein K435DRAFT_862200 [Dendrothele bispora CBS 962.96]